MIAMLEGEVVVVDLPEQYIFLKINRGVTYLVRVIEPLIERLADVEVPIEELALFIYTVYKENNVTLYGFETLEERRMFGELISVKGVGPATALTILSDMEYDELAEALTAEDLDKFIAINGIGKATANNIISKLGQGE